MNWKKPEQKAKNGRDITKDLLTRLFDNTSIAENDYINFAERKPRDQVRGGGIFSPISFEAYVGSYRKGMGSSINSLEGIRDRLELYDEPSETSQHTSGNKEVSDTPHPTVGYEVFIVHGTTMKLRKQLLDS